MTTRTTTRIRATPRSPTLTTRIASLLLPHATDTQLKQQMRLKVLRMVRLALPSTSSISTTCEVKIPVMQLLLWSKHLRFSIIQILGHHIRAQLLLHHLSNNTQGTVASARNSSLFSMQVIATSPNLPPLYRDKRHRPLSEDPS